MRAPILVLRVSRRAVAAVLLSEESLALFDGLHLRSRREAAVQGFRAYIQRLIGVIHPHTIVVDAPKKPGSQTDVLLDTLGEELRKANLTATELSSSTILSAFGLPALESRRQLRTVAEPLFAELAAFHGQIKPYILEAAASALVVETTSALGGDQP